MCFCVLSRWLVYLVLLLISFYKKHILVDDKIPCSNSMGYEQWGSNGVGGASAPSYSLKISIPYSSNVDVISITTVPANYWRHFELLHFGAI